MLSQTTQSITVRRLQPVWPDRIDPTYLPWYTPHAIEVPLEVSARGPFYTARATSVPAT